MVIHAPTHILSDLPSTGKTSASQCMAIPAYFIAFSEARLSNGIGPNHLTGHGIGGLLWNRFSDTELQTNHISMLTFQDIGALMNWEVTALALNRTSIP